MKYVRLDVLLNELGTCSYEGSLEKYNSKINA
ncbi:MAG: hypothetical protein ACI9IT_001907 [Glaciecola sp.]|jgi:hypothetical protein